jgi:uncharacterized coiled-coil protein SlyX
VAKLIKILAASVGGGLMLGAGIRLGEAIVGGNLPHQKEKETDSELAVRLGALEDRLRNLEAESPGSMAEVSSPGSRIEDQAAEVAAIRSQLSMGGRELETLSEISLRLRGELRGWLEETVGARMADVESKLKAESEESQRQLLEVLVESVQTRVTHRISRLEEEVAGQSAAMTELRECTMRTEQSMQKLLGGLDRLIVAQPPPVVNTPAPEQLSAQNVSAEAVNTTVDAETTIPVEEPKAPEEAQPLVEWKLAAEPRPKSRRWSIFG